MHSKSFQSCLTLCDPMDCRPPGSSVHGDSPGKNTGVSCQVLFHGIFQTQRSNVCLSCLLHWQACSLPLLSPGKPLWPWYFSVTLKKFRLNKEVFFLKKRINGITRNFVTLLFNINIYVCIRWASQVTQW